MVHFNATFSLNPHQLILRSYDSILILFFAFQDGTGPTFLTLYLLDPFGGGKREPSKVKCTQLETPFTIIGVK